MKDEDCTRLEAGKQTLDGDLRLDRAEAVAGAGRPADDLEPVCFAGIVRPGIDHSDGGTETRGPFSHYAFDDPIRALDFIEGLLAAGLPEGGSRVAHGMVLEFVASFHDGP